VAPRVGRPGPGFLVAGEPLNFGVPARLGSGPAFVVEGDEYSTSYADKGPKFLHYAPRTLILTSSSSITPTSTAISTT